MENVRTVLVHVDAFDLLGVHVAGDIRPLVDDKNRFARFLCLMCEYSTVKAGAYNQIIIRHNTLS